MSTILSGNRIWHATIKFIRSRTFLQVVTFLEAKPALSRTTTKVKDCQILITTLVISKIELVTDNKVLTHLGREFTQI